MFRAVLISYASVYSLDGGRTTDPAAGNVPRRVRQMIDQGRSESLPDLRSGHSQHYNSTLARRLGRNDGTLNACGGCENHIEERAHSSNIPRFRVIRELALIWTPLSIRDRRRRFQSWVLEPRSHFPLHCDGLAMSFRPRRSAVAYRVP